jgi:hypothetical protein
MTIVVCTVFVMSLMVRNWLWLLPGTIIHELWHWLVGLLTFAGPNNFSVRPDNTVYGQVWFSNLNSFNALPTAIAPLLTVPVVWFLWPWLNTVCQSPYEVMTVGWIVGTALAMSWPSAKDWSTVKDHPWGSAAWAAVIIWLTVYHFGVTIYTY